MVTATPREPEEILRVEGLTRRYGRNTALDGLEFSVRRGDIFGFLGPNGAGKTTTIRILMGLIHPTAGRVRVFGEAGQRASLAARARMGALVEIPAFYRHLSGRANLRVTGALAGVDDDGEIAGKLDAVGLTGPADDPVRTYSQGMRQRLGLAAALLGDPELVLLDEPTNGLDPHGVKEMRRLIVKRNREAGTTFVISSHQLAEIEQICNRVAILRKGRLLVTGPVDGILDREARSYLLDVDDREAARAALGAAFGIEDDGARLRLATDRDGASKAVAALVAAGVQVRELSPVRPSLEDYFLEVTDAAEVDLGR